MTRKKANRPTAKFEMRRVGSATKKQKYLTIRGSNGKIISSVSAKKLRQEGLTKEQALKRFARTRSFNQKILSRNRFSNGFVQTISKQQFGAKKRSQIGVEVTIKKRNKIYRATGYSNLGNLSQDGEDEATRRALIGLVNQNVIDYNDIDNLTNKVDRRVFYINFNFLSQATEQQIGGVV